MLTWLSDCTIGILEAYVVDKMIFKKPPQHFNKRKMPSQGKKKKSTKNSKIWLRKIKKKNSKFPIIFLLSKHRQTKRNRLANITLKNEMN